MLTTPVRLLPLLPRQCKMANSLRPPPAPHFHLHSLHWRGCHLCWRCTIRRTQLGPHGAHRSLAVPRRPLLRSILLRPRSAGRQHLRQQPLRRERPDCAIPTIRQYPARPAPLRRPRVGACSVENSEERGQLFELHGCVRRVPGSYCCYSSLRFLDRASAQVRYAGAVPTTRHLPIHWRRELARRGLLCCWSRPKLAWLHCVD
jgi:hypothetical protein